MKYLSFSLWGNSPIYNVGAIKNALLWKEIYSDWQMVVFYDNTVPNETIDELNKLGVMRDHPYHMIPCGNDRLGILGGMWGIKSKKIPLTKMINAYPNKGKIFYGEDQTFLKTVFSLFENDRCTHDEFFEKKPFPLSRQNGRFIGERIDENENPLTDDYLKVL